MIAVDHQACILCDRCIRACDDIQSNEVIGRTGKGYTTRIAFDLDDPMGKSTCVSCGECVAACPTGALTNKPITLPLVPRAQLTAGGHASARTAASAARSPTTSTPASERSSAPRAATAPATHGRLCVKGRYGWDYAHARAAADQAADPPRGVLPQGPAVATRCAATATARGASASGRLVDYAEVLPAFREATWDEALDLIASRLLRDQGRARTAGAGRLRLGQVQQRGGLPLPEADARRLRHQQRRPLHPALPRLVGRGAARGRSAPARSPTSSATPSTPTLRSADGHQHRPRTTRSRRRSSSRRAQARRPSSIVVDPRAAGHRRPRRRTTARFKPGTDVAFYNAVMHVLIARGPGRPGVRRASAPRTSRRCKATVANYPPERVAPVCGVAGRDDPRRRPAHRARAKP